MSLFGKWIRTLHNARHGDYRRRAQQARGNWSTVDALEDRVLLAFDFGDAPDTNAGTGVGNYQTLSANGGPRHVIDATKMTLFLGAGVDAESNGNNSPNAGGDDLFSGTGRDDEDGILSWLDLQGTVGATPSITVLATNTTGRDASLYGWIDLNRNGVFENSTERVLTRIPNGTSAGRFTVKFPMITGASVGRTVIRLRLSTDAAAASPLGIANDGEVEDHPFSIVNRTNTTFVSRETKVLGPGLSRGTASSSLSLFGMSTSAIGDIDRNGTVDLAVTDPKNGSTSSSGGNRGAVHILLMNPDNSVKKAVKIGSSLGGGPALAVDDFFGSSVTSLGDIDGDGITDIAVGAAGDGAGSPGRGAVYILNLRTDGVVKKVTKISSGLNGGPILGDKDEFGSDVTSPGDLDGDGTTDLIVGAPGTDVDGTDRGAVYVLYLNSNGTVKRHTTIRNNATWNRSPIDYEAFGARIEAVGDLDSDGISELAAVTSSNFYDTTDTFPNTVHLLKLRPDGTVASGTVVTGQNGVPPFDEITSVWDVTSIGDIDGDGRNELAISFGWPMNPQTGAVGVLKVSQNLYSEKYWPTDLQRTDSTYSASLTGLGDLDGDGEFELAWGLPATREGEQVRGIVNLNSFVHHAPRTEAPAVPMISNSSTVTNNNYLLVSWDSSPTATQFDVWFQDDATGRLLWRGTAYSNNFVVPQAFTSGRYRVQVRARNEAGDSAWSQPYVVTISRTVVTTEAYANLGTGLRISWQQMHNVFQYEVWVNSLSNPGVSVFRTKISGDKTFFETPIQLPEGNYNIQIREVTADGRTEPWSSPRTISVVTKIQALSVTNEFSVNPQLNWDLMLGASSYEIWLNDLGHPSRPAIRVNAATRSQRLTGLQPGLYRAWVRGMASTGRFGVWSEPIDFYTATPPELITTSQDLTVGDSLTIQWKPVTRAHHYEVWIDDPERGLTPQTSIHSVTESRFSFEPSQQGQYTVWVRIVSSDGASSPWSQPLRIVAKRQVASVSYDARNYLRPVFQWAPVPDSVAYDIEIEGVRIRLGKVVGYKPDSDVPIGTYRVRVRSISSDGTAGLWSPDLVYNSAAVPVLQPVTTVVDLGITLNWILGDPASKHRVGLGNRATMQSINPDVLAPGVSSLLLNLPDGTYSWTVYSLDSKMESFPATFVIDRTVRVTSSSNQQNDQPVVLTWTSLAGADHYDVWITDIRGTLVLRNQDVQTPDLRLPSSIVAGDYRVWVRAVSATGAMGGWSPLHELSVVRGT